MSEEKNHEPSEKRLSDARERGEVAKSTDLTSAVTFLVSVALLAMTPQALRHGLEKIVRASLDFIGNEHSVQDMLVTLQSILSCGIGIVLLFSIASAVAAVLTTLPQVGLAISFEPVIPKPDAINPANGLQRMFSLKVLGAFARSLIKTILMGVVMWKTIERLFPLAANSASQPLGVIMQVSWSALLELFWIAATIFLLIGLLDHKFQAWMFLRQHRMSTTELKQEYKESEGDPHIKGQRKELAREIAFSPSLKKAISTSNAVVTNPTHYAVAIRYAPNEKGFALPRIVAKGRDEEALLLKRIARESKVPIISNPRVARALFTVPVQQAIPENLFEIVAAILRWVQSVGGNHKVSSDV